MASSVTTTSAKVDLAYAHKARREWEQRFCSRKFELPPRAPQACLRPPAAGKAAPGDPPRRKRSEGSVSPPAISPGRLAEGATKHAPPAGRRHSSLSTAPPSKWPLSLTRKTEPRRFDQPSVTILRIREPECVPAVDLSIPCLNKDPTPCKAGCKRCRPDQSPKKAERKYRPLRAGEGHLAPSTALQLSPPFVSAAASLATTATSSPDSSFAAPHLVHQRCASASALCNMVSSKPSPSHTSPANQAIVPGVTRLTQPRTLAFVFPILQIALQQSIITPLQLQQLTTLFATKPLPAPPEPLEPNSTQPSPEPVRPLKALRGHSFSSTQQSPGPGGHPPARPLRDALASPSTASSPKHERGPPSLSVEESSDLVKAVRSALQRGTFDGGPAKGAKAPRPPLAVNGHKEAQGHPASPTSSCNSLSERSSVVSESRLPGSLKVESPRTRQAVMYRTNLGDTVIIPPLNFRMLKKP